jgi:hypothetical protein
MKRVVISLNLLFIVSAFCFMGWILFGNSSARKLEIKLIPYPLKVEQMARDESDVRMWRGYIEREVDRLGELVDEMVDEKAEVSNIEGSKATVVFVKDGKPFKMPAREISE